MKTRERYTRTICPSCFNEIDGIVKKDDSGVVLSRYCEFHGYSITKLSSNDEYLELDRFYFSIINRMGKTPPIKNCCVILHSRCNQKCIYCSIDANNNKDVEPMAREDISNIYKYHKDHRIILTGGEPTIHPHFIDYLKEGASRSLNICFETNALMLADKQFCERLKGMNIKEICVSLDSFAESTFIKLGDEFICEKKMAALENLKRSRLPVSISPTILKGINDKECRLFLEYALKNNFVNGIHYKTFYWSGRGMRQDKSRVIFPDELMDRVYAYLAENKFSVTRGDIFTFQKFMHFLCNAILKMRMCINMQSMILIRRNGKWHAITEFLNIKRLDMILGITETMFNFNQTLGKACFLFMVFLCVRPKALLISNSLFRLVSKYLFGNRQKESRRNFLIITVSTHCSAFFIDVQNSRNCMLSIIHKEKGKVKSDPLTMLNLDNLRKRNIYKDTLTV